MSTVTDYQFAIGDGVTTAFDVMNPDGNISDTPVISTLYKTDWQGKNALSSAPRTNLQDYSLGQDVSWTKEGGSISSGAIKTPDGVTTALLYTENGANSDHRFYRVAAFVSGHTYTTSVIIKYAGRRYVGLNASSASVGNGARACFDIQNGAVTNAVGATAAIVSLGGGWYRISATYTADNTNSRNVPIYSSNVPNPSTGAVFVGLNGPAFYLGGVQTEESSSATPYIPTAAATVTVTDYTLVGSVATLSPAPLDRALLAWTGTDNNAAFNPRQDGTSMSGKFGTQGVV